MQSLKTKKFTCRLNVIFAPEARQNTLVRFEPDFDELAGGKLGTALVDPHTIRVIRRMPGGEVKTRPVQFDELLYTQNRGWIAWTVEDHCAGGEWSVEFRRRGARGELADMPYMPAVGVGDELYAQAEKYNPICVPGMHAFPIAVDFDNDGKVDIISSSHYSNTLKMPWAGIFFWKNIGTNAHPRFAPPLRLSADGVDLGDPTAHHNREYEFAPRHDFISEYYIRCDVFDWFGSGRSDLITMSQSGGIRIYRNLGTLDAAGLPRLELALKLPLPKCLAPGLPGMRVVDWDDSGRGSLLLRSGSVDEGVEYGQLFILHNVGGTPEKPEFALRLLPVSHLWRADMNTADLDQNDSDWRKYMNFTGIRGWQMDYFDIDGDGKDELIVLHSASRSDAKMEVWRNVGTPERPILRNVGLLPWYSKPHGFSFRFIRNVAFDGCIIAGTNSGDGMCYFKRIKSDPFKPHAYRNQGLLVGQGVKLRSAGYTRPWPIYRADGTLELVLGDEPGYLSLVENYGSGSMPRFAWPRRITDRHGQPLLFMRENIMHDNNLEWCCGQLKPCVADWDGDGKLDIIFSGNTDRIFWLKDFDRKHGRVGRVIELKVKDNLNPFGWRKGVVARDFDDDGICELLAVNFEQELCLYKQTANPAVLTEYRKLRFTDGKVITTNDIPPQRYRYPVVVFFAFDYTGSGSYDLLVSSNYNTSLLENIGTNSTPIFKRPILLQDMDGPISIGHHETQVAAGDVNRDGTDEIMIGGESGTIYIFHRDWLDGVANCVTIASEKRD